MILQSVAISVKLLYGDISWNHKDNIDDAVLTVNDEDEEEHEAVEEEYETVKTMFMKHFQVENYTQTNH